MTAFNSIFATPILETNIGVSEDIINSANPEDTLRNVDVVATVLDGKFLYQNEKYDL